MKNLNIKNLKIRLLMLAVTMFWALSMTGKAQTSVFTYQGRFTDSTVAQPTNGTYNMQFAMFDAASNGNQVGAPVVVPAVQVINGIFTVSLDYAAASFDGSPRFLQVTVGNTVLNPRQEITSAPYAIRARSATLADDSSKLGGINADQYVTGQVVRSVNNLTNNVTLAAGSNVTITPSGNTLTISATGGGAGSENYIQNQLSSPQSANFQIDGSGIVGGFLSGGIVSTQTFYRIGTQIILGTPNATSLAAGQSAGFNATGGNNAFFGYKTGAAANNTGQGNVFFGSEAGTTNSNGGGNSFVGRDAGFFNSSGSANSFFGNSAGKANTIASFNSFFGTGSGNANTTGERNSYFGFQSGQIGKTAADNSFFGYQAGKANTGAGNTFVGSQAGNANLTGGDNTYVGFNSGSIGSGNTSVGSGSGGDGDGNTFIGKNAGGDGDSNTAVGNGAKIQRLSPSSPPPNNATAIGAGAVVNSDNTVVLGTDQDFVRIPGNLKIFGSAFVTKITADQMVITGGGSLKLNGIPFATTVGNHQLCLNGNDIVSRCPGDINKPDSEQTAQIETQAAQINEQNTQIVKLIDQNQQQQAQIEALKQIVCQMNPAAKICGKK